MTVAWWTVKGKAEAAIHSVPSVDLRLALVSSAPASQPVALGMKFLSQVTGSENQGTGYVRKAITGINVAEDDNIGKAVFKASNPTAHTGADFGTVVGGWLYRHTGSDATAPLWLYVGLAEARITNGEPFEFLFNPNGISYLG